MLLLHQGVKNEAEDYMLKELSLLKWQEKATNLASEKNVAEVAELQAAVSSLEANVKIERCFCRGLRSTMGRQIGFLITSVVFDSQGEN